MFSIFAALILPCILPVVLVFSLLGLFIHVADLSSIRFKCLSSSVWLHFFVVNDIVLISSAHVLLYVVVAFSDCSQMAPSSPKKKTPAKKADKRMKMDLNLFSCFEGRGWEKLLSDLPVVCEPLIREFYSNAVIREDDLSC